MYAIKFPAIAPSAAHNFSVKTIEFKMAAVSVKRSIVCVINLLSNYNQSIMASQCRVRRCGRDCAVVKSARLPPTWPGFDSEPVPYVSWS